MQEFSSISVSSYEAGALAEKLTEQSKDGWSVVSIVPTGSAVTAYLSRDVEAASDDATDTSDDTSAAGDDVDDADAPAEAAIAPEPAEISSDAGPGTIAAAAAALGDDDSDGDDSTGDESTGDDSHGDADESDTTSVDDMASVDDAVDDVVDDVTEDAADTVGEAIDEPGGWASESGSEIAAAAAAMPEAATPSPAGDVTAAAATPAAGAAPAGWYADPSSRFELRYWDGGQWTEHVSRSGQQYTDPPVA